MTGAKMFELAKAFSARASRFQVVCPFARVENLQNIRGDPMKHLLGSIGVLKTQLLRLKSMKMTSRVKQLALRWVRQRRLDPASTELPTAARPIAFVHGPSRMRIPRRVGRFGSKSAPRVPLLRAG